MSETRYIISDASKQVDVEAHVLRYWEEELELKIKRNEMGHRYYTEDDIRLLKNIKELKEQGFQLKAIKMLLPELEHTDGANLDKILSLKEELNSKADTMEDGEIPLSQDGTSVETRISSVGASSSVQVKGISQEKMQQFQLIMGDIVSRALKENNHQLGAQVSSSVSENLMKEMDYLMRMKDEKEDERFRKLDETMREYQKARQEIAVSEEMTKGRVKKQKKKKGLFRKKAANSLT
jgi:DNA-binding transcriptional MerR regulator